MKICPKCKTMLEDDELFCHECGTKQELEEVAVQNEETVTQIEKKCIHCGETIEEDSAFCPCCGKPQIVENEKSEKQKEKAKVDEKPTPKEAPVQEEPVEQTTYEWEEKPKSKTWLWILLAVLLVGGGIWYFISGDNDITEVVDTPAEIVDAESQEDEVVVEEVTGPHSFLEQFYKKYGDETYLLDHITANVKNKLRRDYEYDCETNDCLAGWVFTAYPAGADMEMEEGPIISESSENGKFKVDFKYSGYNGEQKQYHMRTVYLTVSQIDGKYVISDYEVVENHDEDNIEDVDIKEIFDGDYSLSDGYMKMTLKKSGSVIYGVYYFHRGSYCTTDSHFNAELSIDNNFQARVYNISDKEIGIIKGTFDGKNMKVSVVSNRNNDENDGNYELEVLGYQKTEDNN